MAPWLLPVALAAWLGAAPTPASPTRTPPARTPPGVAALLARAARALAAGRPQVAEATYRQALARAPEDTPGRAEALHGLGSALFRLGRGEEALVQLRAATELAPAALGAQLDLGFAALALGQPQVAAAAYARAAELAPAEPEALYGLGESLLRTGARAGAVVAFEQYLAHEERASARPWVERTRARLDALKAREAAPPAVLPGAAQPQSTALPPTARPHPLLCRARLDEADALMRARRFRAAAFAYQDAAHADPTSVEAAFKLGNAYAVLGFYAQAVSRWREALALSADADVRRRAADNIRQAQARIAAQGGGSPLAGARAGQSAELEAERDRARTAYDEGVVRLAEPTVERAVRLLTEAVRENPALAQAFVARGRALLQLQRLEEAAADFQHALRLAPELGAPLYGLAEALRQQGRTFESKTFYARYAGSQAGDVRPELQRDARERAGRGP